MATLTFVGGSGDGKMWVNDAATWADARGRATASGNDTTSIYLQPSSQFVSGTTYVNYRNLLLPDTAGLPDNATITLVKLTLACNYTNGTAARSVHVVTPGITSVTNAGYALANWGASSLGSVSSPFVVGTAYDIPITGLAVNKTGITYIGLRSGFDLNNIAPTDASDVAFASADATNAAYRPALTVEYTVPASGHPFYFARNVLGRRFA